MLQVNVIYNVIFTCKILHLYVYLHQVWFPVVDIYESEMIVEK